MNKFDWHSEKLSPNTEITDTYKNTQNARRFFKSQIGEHFHFNIEFMAWMKKSKGRKLKDAVKEWKKKYS